VRLLAVTAVEAEAHAVLRDLDDAAGTAIGPYAAWSLPTPAGQLVVVAGGIGPAAAAAVTATALSLASYDVVLSLGIAGGVRGRADVGDVVVADRVIAADLGADSPEGFQLLPGSAGEWPLTVPDPLVLAERLSTAGLRVRTGGVLTVATVTGTEERAALLAAAHPGAVAEAMEGHGVLTACLAHTTAFVEVRSVSNVVERRNRAAWDVRGALEVLSAAAAALFAGPLPGVAS
jgi:futalosine hydrolase